MTSFRCGDFGKIGDANSSSGCIHQFGQFSRHICRFSGDRENVAGGISLIVRGTGVGFIPKCIRDSLAMQGTRRIQGRPRPCPYFWNFLPGNQRIRFKTKIKTSLKPNFPPSWPILSFMIWLCTFFHFILKYCPQNRVILIHNQYEFHSNFWYNYPYLLWIFSK